jgi:hypothetical protein
VINELRMNIDNIKEEGTQDMENLRKKNETEMQNKMEGQSRRLEQIEELLVKEHRLVKKNARTY